MAESLPVRRYGQNKGGDYYKVNEKFNVIHLVGCSVDFACVDCPSNTCEHVTAVKRFIDSREPVRGAA